MNECGYEGDPARDPGFAYRVSGCGSCRCQSSLFETCCGGCVGRRFSLWSGLESWKGVHDSDRIAAGERSLWLRSALLASRRMFRVDAMISERFVGGAVRRGAAKYNDGKKQNGRVSRGRCISLLTGIYFSSSLYDRHLWPVRPWDDGSAPVTDVVAAIYEVSLLAYARFLPLILVDNSMVTSSVRQRPALRPPKVKQRATRLR